MDKNLLFNIIKFLLVCLTFPRINANSNIELLESKKADERRPFEGHKIVRAFPVTKKEADLISSLEFNPDIEVDFWARTRNIDIHVEPENFRKLDVFLKRTNIQYAILNNNLQRSLDEEQKAHYRVSKGWHGDYHPYEQIVQKITNLANTYNTRSHIINIGKSYEQRDILGLEITGDNKVPKRQKAVIICGQHAREWIAPATCMYMMDKILENYGRDANTTAMVDRFNWVIFPLVNPDGYVYTWKSKGHQHRLWRKNRQPNINSTCHGTDLNRNWEFKWAGSGSSNLPCSDIYRGTSPFSAPEAKAIAEYTQANEADIFSLIDIHSYSQLWMYPWSYTKDITVNDEEELSRVSTLSVEALKRLYETDFQSGPAGVIIYEAAGSSKDWGYGKLGIKYAFALELRDTGKHGFLLPKEQIAPSGEETLYALKTLAKSVVDYGQKSTSYYQADDDTVNIKKSRTSKRRNYHKRKLNDKSSPHQRSRIIN